MNIVETDIADVLLFEPKVFADERGFFMETFRQSYFDELDLNFSFVQDNHSASQKGVLRGLHYQIRNPQGKLVRVIRGEIYDVAVDIREGSSTFGQYVAETLSEQNRKMLWVPPGFAHGFCVTSDQAEIVYKSTDYYAPNSERVLMWNDPEIGIAWPLESGERPILSLKDQQGKPLKDIEVF